MTSINYEELLRQIASEFEIGFNDLCFQVTTSNFDFPFSFFAFETEDVLGLLVTDENGMEKLHIIVKDNIEYLRLHYLDELEGIFNVEDDNKHRKVGIYE